MKKEEAEIRAKNAGRSKNFIFETWYCGIINQNIEEATEKGLYETKVRFSSRSYVSKHQQRFIEIYESEGYEVHFRPNYVHIEPSMWDLIIRWFPEENKKLTN
ncbi:MAG: hypothetical protein J6P40_06485 [Oscillospiraceae bacterium]|nr:hypothetical protein [Oscillospiraceae bacterium]